MQIESKMISWLNARELSAEAMSSAPAGRSPHRCVTVERTGGPSDGFIDHPTVAVQSWAATKAEAEALALEVDRVLVGGFADGVEIVSITRSGLAWFPTTKKEPRYQALYSIAAYEGRTE